LTRSLRILFVRPADGTALDSALRFASPRELSDQLPVDLLRLASAVKLCSPHRVFVHDARRGEGGRSLRSVATLHDPDVSIVQLHPALLADGLEATRAVRHSGRPLVIGTGPLVDLWPEGARRIPELDGLLPTTGHGALLDALARLARGAPARELAEALAGPPGPPPDGPVPTERKLLDYAGYRCVPGRWPGTPAHVRRRPDKGRWAATTIPLHDEDGRALGPGEVLDEMAACDLIGIRWQALVPGTGRAPLPLDWWHDLLEVLRIAAGRAPASRQVRASMAPAVTRRTSLGDLRSLGIVAIDLGDVDPGDPEGVEQALQAGRACRRAGLEASATVLLGRPGYALDEERRGLEQLRAAELRVEVGVRVHVGTVDVGAWTDQLDAPSAGFVPPGVDPGRLDLVRRTARLEQARSVRSVELPGLRERLKALFDG
jgi:hypothetical protein